MNLASEFKQGDRWKLDYLITGTRNTVVTQVDPSHLHGTCAKATHFISGMAVGAYQLISEASQFAQTEVSLLKAGAGGKRKSEAGIIRHGGQLERCSSTTDKADDKDCQALVQLFLKPIVPPETAEASFQVGFSSNPSVATVSVDGVRICDATPCSGKLFTGWHRVEMIQGYQSRSEQVNIIGPSNLNWDLEKPPDRKGYSIVLFLSRPSGAVVRVDGQLLCQSTPCSKNIEHGSHDVSMELENHIGHREPVVVEDSKEVSWQLEPDFGWMSVSSERPGLEVSIDGESIGKTPIHEFGLSSGTHVIHVSSDCYGEFTERITVERGRKYNIRAPSRKGILQVTAEDDLGRAINAQVYVDDKQLGHTPDSYEVSICAKQLILKNAEGVEVVKTLEISQNQIHDIQAVFPSLSKEDIERRKEEEQYLVDNIKETENTEIQLSLAVEFLEKYPNSYFVEEIRSLIDSLDDEIYTSLSKSTYASDNNIKNCHRYLNLFESGKHQSQVQTILNNMQESLRSKFTDVDQCENSRRWDAKNYLKLFPTGIYSADAQSTIHEIRGKDDCETPLKLGSVFFVASGWVGYLIHPLKKKHDTNPL